jgi:hypothetical protein
MPAGRKRKRAGRTTEQIFGRLIEALAEEALRKQEPIAAKAPQVIALEACANLPVRLPVP